MAWWWNRLKVMDGSLPWHWKGNASFQNTLVREPAARPRAVRACAPRPRRASARFPGNYIQAPTPCLEAAAAGCSQVIFFV